MIVQRQETGPRLTVRGLRFHSQTQEGLCFVTRDFILELDLSDNDGIAITTPTRDGANESV
jgi:hypothetical protein